MSLKWQFGQPVRGDGRELKPQLLDSAGKPKLLQLNSHDLRA